jgi:guanylate kinase
MFSHNQGIIFILSAPSGGGKTTIARALCKIIPNLLLSISTTTRDSRPNEIDGQEYFFKTKQEFEELITHDELLEYAKIYDNYYGTLKSYVYEPLAQNIDVLFDIDWQGAKFIKEKVVETKVVSIFILPPSIEILKQRLINRDQDTTKEISRRLSLALEEISHAKDYDYIVINEDFDKAVEEIKSIIIAERIKSSSKEKLSRYSVIH